MAVINSFEDIKAFQKAREFNKEIYIITNTETFKTDFDSNYEGEDLLNEIENCGKDAEVGEACTCCTDGGCEQGSCPGGNQNCWRHR